MFNFFDGMGGMPGQGQEEQEDVDTETMYKTLGVAKNAEANQIKKAYRKMAMRHHPDKGGDPEKFKEITKAHEILSDPEKREKYDRGGEKALEGGGGGGGGGAQDIFSAMFGGHGGGGHRGPRKGKDVLFRLKVQLDDLYSGATKSLRLTKNVVCDGCAGKGGKGVMKCSGCKGRGVRLIVRQLGPGMIQQMQAQCDQCDGEGEIIPPSGRCRECGGNKVCETKTTLKVHINKGMANGEKVMFRGEADQQPGLEPGDVVVQLECVEHPIFTRKGTNLFFKKKISLVEALCGFEFSMTHLDGRVLLVKSDAGTVYEHNCMKVIRDEGMPMAKNPTQTGNLYIEFLVEFPKSITPEQRKLLKKALPKPESMDDDDYDPEEVEEVELQNVDMDAERRKFAEARRGEAYDEDEGGGGGQQQQCRAQ